MNFYDAVHIPEAGSHLLQTCKQVGDGIHISSNTYIRHILQMIWCEAVTFSHVSGEPVGHIASPEVEHGSELVDSAESLVQSHGR